MMSGLGVGLASTARLMLDFASNNSFDRSAASRVLMVTSILHAAHGQLGR